jgi:transcriptional regulator with XRE-family HTH domain
MATHPIDIHVGQRLRTRRNQCKLSQEELAKSVGVTFQQIQKYEKGSNRIAPSRMYYFAKALKCDFNWFIDEYDDDLKYSDQMDQSCNEEKEFFKLKEFFCSLPIESQKVVGRLIKHLSTLNQ